MANIDVNLSNALITTLKGNTATDTIGDDLSLFFQADYAFTSGHPVSTSFTQTDSSLRLNYADGAYENYNAIVLSNPNALSGSATSGSLEEYVPSAYRLTTTGQLNYHYDVAGGTLNILGQGGTLKAAAFQTLAPTTSPNYDPTLGNISISMEGNVNLAANGGISGTVSSLSMAAEHLLTSSTLTGNFSVSGNAISIGQNASVLAVSGTATSFSEKYLDGSSVSMTNLAIPVTGATAFNKTLLANAANFAGDDVINVTLGAVAVSPWKVASGAGNDKVMIKGGGSSLSVDAGAGNDIITLGDSNHSIDGGAGTDTAVFSGARAAYTLTKTATGYTVQSSAGTDTLTGVERLQFSDSTLALDVSGNAGQVYRLYQAAFNRTPDAGGLGYWIKVMDSGVTLQSIAADFVKSGEFTTMYGANPSNADFLDKLYHNVLHRAGDTDGFNWWLDGLDQHATTQANVLADFGESAENQAALIGSIGNGFTYTPYG